MELNKIFFSPTCTTKQILDGISEGLAANDISEFDLESLDNDFHLEIKSGITIFGMPVFDGELAKLAAKQLSKFSADKQICIVVVSYGNKDYKKLLNDFKEIVSSNGFIPIATAAFLGNNLADPEHFKIDMLDDADYRACVDFGIRMKDKLESDKKIINEVINKTELKEKDI